MRQLNNYAGPESYYFGGIGIDRENVDPNRLDSRLVSILIFSLMDA